MCRLPLWLRLGNTTSDRLRPEHGEEPGARRTGRGSLQQRFGLPGGVLGLEVLVGVHLVFYGEQLGLQLVPEGRQGVSNVVGELLNETEQSHAQRRQVED